jgi:hypothetical protein
VAEDEGRYLIIRWMNAFLAWPSYSKGSQELAVLLNDSQHFCESVKIICSLLQL